MLRRILVVIAGPLALVVPAVTALGPPRAQAVAQLVGRSTPGL